MRILRASSVLVAGIVAGPLWAAGGVATDGAVSLTYDPAHWGAAPLADLRGTEATASADLLFQMGWWYRVEGDDREHPMPPPDVLEGYTVGTVTAQWSNVDGKGFSAQELTYVFDNEGPSGSVWSTLFMTNNNASARSIAIYHYLDVDVDGTLASDTGEQLSSRYLKFKDGTAVVRYRSDSADHFAVKAFPQIRALLNDAAVNDLDDTGLPFSSGDVTAAFECSRSIPPGLTLALGVSVSSRLPRDHIRGAYHDLTSYPAVQAQDVVAGANLVRPFRHTRMLGNTTSYGVAPGFELVARDDFSGDLADELVTRHPATGELTIGYAALTGAASPPPNWILASTGDFNLDGKADILWRNQTSGQLSVWLMNGHDRIAAILPSPDHAAASNWAVAGTGDFNADGLRDILWYNQTSGNLVIWYMNLALQRVTGAFTSPPSVGDNNWRVVAVGDLGLGPGGVHDTQDIVWQNSTSGNIVAWFMDATGTRTSGTFTTPSNLGATLVVTGPR